MHYYERSEGSIWGVGTHPRGAIKGSRPSRVGCPTPGHHSCRPKAAQLACHESERTTRMYDRSDDPITLDEIERVNYRTEQ